VPTADRLAPLLECRWGKMADKLALVIGRLVPMADKPVLKEYRFVLEDCRLLKRFRMTFLVIQLVLLVQKDLDNLEDLVFLVVLQDLKVHENRQAQENQDNLDFQVCLEAPLVLMARENQQVPVIPENQEIPVYLEVRQGLVRRENQDFRPGRDNHPFLVYQVHL